MLVLLLIRHKKTLEHTMGELFDASNKYARVCDTLEDRIRDIDGNGDLLGEGEEKVYGETAIPYGEYEIEVTYSPKLKKRVVLIKDVPHFEGIRMHFAATAKNIEGCVGVGEYVEDGLLRDIGMTDKLVEMLDAHGNKGKIKIL